MLEIKPDNWYSEQFLRTYGVSMEALRLARKAGELPFRDLRGGTRLYLGTELLAWFARHRVPAAAEAEAPA